MARTCTICSHKQRLRIEAAIASGGSYRHIASQFRVGYKAVERHKEHCMKPAIQEFIAKQEELSAFNTLSEMEWMRQQTRAIYTDVWSEKSKDHRTALQALAEIRRQTELHSELTGELDRSTHIELSKSEDWLNMRELIFRALEPFPEARIAVATAIYQEGQRGRSIA